MSEKGWEKKESRGMCVDFQQKKDPPTIGQKTWKWLWDDKKEEIKKCDGEVFRYECKVPIGTEWLVKCEKCENVYDRGFFEKQKKTKKQNENLRNLGQWRDGTTVSHLADDCNLTSTTFLSLDDIVVKHFTGRY